MNALTKNMSLVSIIIFLLLSNIAILIYFLYFNEGRRGSHGKDGRNAISTFLQKEIGFNQQQMDEYQKLKTAQMESVKPLFNNIRSAKESFYNLLYVNNPSDSGINSAAAVIGEKQMALDMKMFNHFKKVRDLSTPQQLPKFDSLFKNVVDKITGGRFRKPDGK